SSTTPSTMTPNGIHLALRGCTTTVCAPYWGSRKELAEVLDLAHAGAVDVHVETYSIDEAPLAYERLHDGRINGRAVILPNG
ncbi:zinc-binding dehydrogenase, partial [Streptomyces californicus]